MANDYTLSAKITGDASGFEKAIGKAQTQLSKIASKFESFGAGCTKVGKALAPVTAGMTALTGISVKTSISFIKLYESTIIVFEKMLGGKEAANELYSSLLDIAKASTFSQETFLRMSKSLIGVGVSADETKKLMKAAADGVSAFGGTSADLERVGYAFRKMATAGKLSMQELDMINDAGINGLKILANQYGVTTDEMRKMISKGAVPAEEAMRKLADGIENGTNGVNGMTEALAGMAEKMKGKTLTGALDSMKSAIRNFALAFVGMNPTLKEGSEGFKENQQRIAQLTASIVTINQIIPLLTKVFAGVTEGIGKFLDKLIGANVTFNEATGEWENAEGVLGRIKTALENADPEKIKIIGDALFGLAVAGGGLIVVGKSIGFITNTLGPLSNATQFAVGHIGNLYRYFSNTSPISSFVSGFKGSTDAVKIAGQGYYTFGQKAQQALSSAGGGLSRFAGFAKTNLGVAANAVKGFILAWGPLALVIGAVIGILVYLWKTNDDFRESITECGKQIMDSFMPVFQQLADLFSQVAQLLAPLIGQIAGALMPAIISIAEALAPVVEALMPVIVTIIQAIAQAIIQLMPIITIIVNFVAQAIVMIVQFITPIIVFIANVIAKIIAIITPIILFITSVIVKIIEVITTIIGAVANIFAKVFQIASNIFTSIGNFIGTVIGVIKGVIETIIGVVSKVFNKVKSIVTGVFGAIKSAWSGLTGFVGGIVSGIGSAFSSLTSRVKRVVNAVISGINGAIGIINKIPGVSISRIAYLYRGTDNWQGGFAAMNEGGRGEITYLPSGTQVIPHDISMKYAKEAARNQNTSVSGEVIRSAVVDGMMSFVNVIENGMSEIAGRPIVLDSGALVGGVIGDIDVSLQSRNIDRERRAL